MYIQREKGFVVPQIDVSLATKIKTAVMNGVQMPDMSTPKDFPSQPLTPENTRFMESADLYTLECATKKKFGNLKERYEKHINLRKLNKESEV